MNLGFDINSLRTPYYIVDKGLLQKNLQVLSHVMKETGCKILLAQKAFSMYELYPLIGQYLSGTTASGLYEARLGYEAMGKENHIFSPAYDEAEFDEILKICGHMVFNSFNQWQRFRHKALAAGKQCGIRINPQHSTQEHSIYDPCAPGSRLGVTAQNFRTELLEGISGLHFHTLCEQNSDALEATLKAVEEKFGKYLKAMKWVNFGGGHHITREGYDINRLIKLVNNFKDSYGVQVYLEPGEAVALDTGFLVAEVMDIVENEMSVAVLNTSAACHMPDVLEMPYRPNIIGAAKPNEKQFTYRLSGHTCLAGDVIGDYSFNEALAIGQRLVFCDMAHYSMVKNNTFNGMRLPSIAVAEQGGSVRLVKEFGYEDFKRRV